MELYREELCAHPAPDMKRRGAAAEDGPAKRSRGSSSASSPTGAARPAARRAAAAKQPDEEYSVGDWLAPPFMRNQFQRLQKVRAPIRLTSAPFGCHSTQRSRLRSPTCSA